MFTLNCKGRLLVIEKPIVMGIVNVTPDSFYDGSPHQDMNDILAKAEQMIKDGATILDIGGQTTKPGSIEIDREEETKRVLPVIKQLRQAFPTVFISVDTYRSKVAKAAVEAGADMVNDISGGIIDKAMAPLAADLKVPYICMHMQGVPQTMHLAPAYKTVTTEVLDFFIERIETCTSVGITDMIIDVGFGFGKTAQHNFQLLKDLPIFKMLGKPILVGISRKSTIYKTLGVTANEALNGSTVLHTVALLNGANILRVHDVREAVEAVKLLGAYDSGI